LLYCTQYNQAYHDYIIQRDALDTRIEIKQQQMNRLSTQIKKLKQKKCALVFPNWIDSVLRPLAKDLEAYLGKPVTVSGPFGLRAEALLRVYDSQEAQTISAYQILTVVPDFSRDTLELRYDTGRIIRDCPPGSIGAINHLDNETLPLPGAIPEIAVLLTHH
jgi:hypothetical protein